jgi:hypothetical protein
MSLDLSELVNQALRRFRRRGFDLGVQEYLSALTLVEESAGDATRCLEISSEIALVQFALPPQTV